MRVEAVDTRTCLLPHTTHSNQEVAKAMPGFVLVSSAVELISEADMFARIGQPTHWFDVFVPVEWWPAVCVGLAPQYVCVRVCVIVCLRAYLCIAGVVREPFARPVSVCACVFVVATAASVPALSG